MAEYGAHLTSSVGENPSIFEVLAQENLSIGLRSAARYLLKLLAETRPDRYSILFQYFEEIYTLLDVAVQYSHLKSYGASFSENFYGLKRVALNSKHQKSTGLPSEVFYKSLILLVGVPYLKQRLHDVYVNLKDRQLDGTLENMKHEMKLAAKTYIRIYPMIHFVWEGCVFYHQLLYSVGRCDWHSPFLRLASAKLSMLTQDDVASFRRSAHVMLQWQKARWSKFPGQLIWFLTQGIAVGLGTSLYVGAFFLQFMEWWYSREDAPASFVPLPCPPPPSKMQVEMDVEKCPLCLNKRHNDTALATTGFVFCYKCIFEYVRRHRRCPVTGYPSLEGHLIRIYRP